MELVFKEWKSYANLHAFDTENEHITETLIWASLAASALKRFFAHAAEQLLEVVMSTRKAAIMPAYVLPELFRALRHGNGPWYRRAFAAMIRGCGSFGTTVRVFFYPWLTWHREIKDQHSVTSDFGGVLVLCESTNTPRNHRWSEASAISTPLPPSGVANAHRSGPCDL